MKLKAYAKINLYLKVLSKRTDGYHNISSLMQEISLFDEIVLQKISKGIKIFCTHPGVPKDRQNLVYKATQLMKEIACKKQVATSGIKITIKKRIPVEAGLGGGSSDAATVIKGLNKLWHLNLSSAQLVKIGAKIGSDVPFFIRGGTTEVKGRGNEIVPLPTLPSRWVILVKPARQVSTKWAYKNLKLKLTNRKKNINIVYYKLSKKRIPFIQTLAENTLEEVVFKKFPIIAQIKGALLGMDLALVLMSGSGSCVFGLAQTKPELSRIKEVLPKKEKYWLWVGKTVGPRS